MIGEFYLKNNLMKIEEKKHMQICIDLMDTHTLLAVKMCCVPSLH